MSYMCSFSCCFRHQFYVQYFVIFVCEKHFVKCYSLWFTKDNTYLDLAVVECLWWENNLYKWQKRQQKIAYIVTEIVDTHIKYHTNFQSCEAIKDITHRSNKNGGSTTHWALSSGPFYCTRLHYCFILSLLFAIHVSHSLFQMPGTGDVVPGAWSLTLSVSCGQ